ncbi:MAG: preprotein translocase subunit Sec61beta [Nanoarchaeota archaeon]
MSSDNKISMPGAFGGLMRYDEEYESKFIFTPMQIMGFLIVIVAFVILLKIFWPVSIVASG